jgi:hypothetical protein
MRTQAWLTAMWSRAKRLPSLNKALGRKPSVTAEQARNDYLELSRRADVIQRREG